MGQPERTGVAGATVVRPLAGDDTLLGAPTEPRGRIVTGLREIRRPLLTVWACGMLASLAGALLIGALGKALLNVPSDFKQLEVPGIFPYAFAPVIGCSVAYTVAFVVKKPGPRSIHLFVTVGVKFALLDSLLAILDLPSSANAGSIATLLVVILYPLVIIPVLLRFVPRPNTAEMASVPATATAV